MIAQRGDVFDVDFPSPVGSRPAIIVTRDVAIPLLRNLTVVPINNTQRGAPTEVAVGPECGLSSDCVASCDNLATVPIELFRRRRGALGIVQLRSLATALRIALALD